MIRLSAWPQLGTAAGFVTAVAVVLNPVTPVLPDVTVPALFPPARGSQTPVPARPGPPAVGTAAIPAIPIVAARTLPTPAAAISGPGPAVRAVSAALPTAAASPPVSPGPDIELPVAPDELRAPVPKAVPLVRIQSPPAALYTGDRPRPVARQLILQPSGPKPLPAAAVRPPETATPGTGAVRFRGRVGSPAADNADPGGHRGPAGPE